VSEKKRSKSNHRSYNDPFDEHHVTKKKLVREREVSYNNEVIEELDNSDPYYDEYIKFLK
jgi:hypothetical protein